MTRALALVVLIAVIPTSAAAQDEDVELYARVIVDTSVIRSGPAATYQRVYIAERGEIFPIRARATRGGYWWQVELPDGTTGWIRGDTVYNHEVGDDEADGGRFLPWLFAPPPLPTASGELSVTFGLLGKTFGFGGGGLGGGFMALRPAFYIDPVFGIEVTAAASVSRGGRIFIGGLGGIVNIFPESPIVPYIVAGAGIAQSDPNADTFLLESGRTWLLYGGGGFRFGFKYRLTLRIEARAYAFHEPDTYVAQEELSGGITVFF